MAGMRFTTDLDAKQLYKLAMRRADRMDFAIRETDRYAFAAESGSLPLSIFLGAFIAYCDFHVSVGEFEGDNELTLERNNPWWTGLIGISRVKTRASELLMKIKDDVEDAGGRILAEEDF